MKLAFLFRLRVFAFFHFSFWMLSFTAFISQRQNVFLKQNVFSLTVSASMKISWTWSLQIWTPFSLCVFILTTSWVSCRRWLKSSNTKNGRRLEGLVEKFGKLHRGAHPSFIVTNRVWSAFWRVSDYRLHAAITWMQVWILFQSQLSSNQKKLRALSAWLCRRSSLVMIPAGVMTEGLSNAQVELWHPRITTTQQLLCFPNKHKYADMHFNSVK